MGLHLACLIQPSVGKTHLGTETDGHSLGTLNVIDRVPGRLNADERNVLRKLGRQVVAQFELRRRALGLTNNCSTVIARRPRCSKKRRKPALR